MGPIKTNKKTVIKHPEQQQQQQQQHQIVKIKQEEIDDNEKLKSLKKKQNLSCLLNQQKIER